MCWDPISQRAGGVQDEVRMPNQRSNTAPQRQELPIAFCSRSQRHKRHNHMQNKVSMASQPGLFPSLEEIICGKLGHHI